MQNNPMQGFDKELVQSKLRELGMNDLASRLEKLSTAEIERMIQKNPEILKKASEMMKGGKFF